MAAWSFIKTSSLVSFKVSHVIKLILHRRSKQEEHLTDSLSFDWIITKFNVSLTISTMIFRFMTSFVLMTMSWGRKECPSMNSLPDFAVALEELSGRWYEVRRSHVQRETSQRCNQFNFSPIETPEGEIWSRTVSKPNNQGSILDTINSQHKRSILSML